ncbi:MAG: hypothetical protein GC149_00410 [Gammaproteobacteria bacterium]|nr:hypothetical protein [Gammaproteobacteria bacterium]
MKKTIILTWALFAVFGLSPLAGADVLTMPQSEPAAPPANTVTETTSQTVPGRGMHMDQVEARFGAPKEKIPAVGEPPITRWVYDNYTVYFEHDIVLDSVIHH